MGQATIKVEGTDPQLEFWLAPERFRAFVGGVGSGKTYAGVLEILRQPPGCRGAVLAPTYRMLMDATLDTLFKLFDKGNLIESWSKSEMRMELTNGTDIIFRSADDPERLRGPNLSWFFLDEAAMMPEMVWDIMIGRLRVDPGRAWATTTPKGMNWLHKLFVRERREGYRMVQCSSYSNTYLPKYFLDSLEGKYTSSFKDQELMGEFVDWVNSPAYESFHRPLHVQKNLMNEYRERLPLKLCCDFNARCMVWPVVQVNGRQPRVLTEIAQVGTTSIPKMIQEFRMMFPNHPGGLQIYGDASAFSLGHQTGQTSYDLIVEELRKFHYPSLVDIMVPKTNPSVRSSVNSMNQVLRGAGEWLPLMIDESCEMLIRDCSFVEWDEKGTDLLKITNPDDDRSTLTHAMDALRYWASLDSPVATSYVTAEDDHFGKMNTTEARRRWMSKLKGEEPTAEGIFGLDLI
jgi:hypothetical protein